MDAFIGVAALVLLTVGRQPPIAVVIFAAAARQLVGSG
jgi:hypothetical protein